jgi:hypothetical protein
MKHEGLAGPTGVTVPRPEPVPGYAISRRDGKAARDVLITEGVGGLISECRKAA